jgi:acyl-coenzyme A thioesterase PaaI-like protein
MTDELDERLALASALRDLNHAFVGHHGDPIAMRDLAARVSTEVEALLAAPRRDRLALMRAAREAAVAAADGGEITFFGDRPQSGFEDRAVAGRANPTSIEFDVAYEDDEVIAAFTLRRAFEGAPGRAHGGMVAAAFDDITGWVIGQLREPAFTGELTVRFVAPVPVDTRLVVRTRLVERERRKLFITAEMTAGDQTVATCKAIYITVDPSVFAGAPDPR